MGIGAGNALIETSAGVFYSWGGFPGVGGAVFNHCQLDAGDTFQLLEAETVSAYNRRVAQS